MNDAIVIVGGGHAAAQLCSALAEAGQGSILVIEAGPRDLSPWVHLPIGYGKTFYHRRMNWSVKKQAARIGA